MNTRAALPVVAYTLTGVSFALAAVSLVISLFWQAEARTVGRGFVSVSIAPIAIAFGLTASVLQLTACALLACHRRTNSPRSPAHPPPPKQEPPADMSLPRFPSP